MYYVTLNLRIPKSKIETSILMYVTLNGRRIKISTKQKIHPSLWRKEKRQVSRSKTKIERYKKYDPGIIDKLSGVQFKIDKLVKEVDRYFLECTVKGIESDLDLLKDHLLRFLNPNTSTTLFNINVATFLTIFIEETKNGIRKKANGRSYKKSSIICYNNLLNTLYKYEHFRAKKLTWKNIDKFEYSAFIKWHEDLGYSVNYLGKHLKDLKSLMRIAYDEKIHTNENFRSKFFAIPKEVNKKIPLSLDEVQKIISLDLTTDRYFDLSRDIFLLGCFLGLRVSDLKQISPQFIHTDKDGSYVKIKTIKTGIEVCVPINTHAMRILKKYNKQLPKFNEQVINRHLKLLGEEIGLRNDRAKKLSIHYSRATFAKLSFEMGIPSLIIMKITGHTTEKSFLHYINISTEEAVTEFRRYDFFK